VGGPSGIGEDGWVTVTQHPAAPSGNSAAVRLARTPMDMAKAVLVLLVPVLVLFGIYVYFFGGSNAIKIDPSGTFSDARASAHFAVLEPQGLSSGWRPISSQYAVGTPSTLRVGYVAPDGAGIQLIESDKPADTFIAGELGNVGAVGRSVTIGGRTWGAVGHALINTDAGRTVIIVGQASDAELDSLAGSLR
jgi:hypothetical protein